jgi:ATP-dependent exoDNAse (exonuclease V) alpha subunit
MGHDPNRENVQIENEPARIGPTSTGCKGHVPEQFQPGGIVDLEVGTVINYFTINGNPASRQQFPLQNSYALTVHKTQGLILRDVSLSLDEQIFSAGQAYVALSRCSSWDHVQIATLNRSAFMTDPDVIAEYERLEGLAASPLPV